MAAMTTTEMMMGMVTTVTVAMMKCAETVVEWRCVIVRV